MAEFVQATVDVQHGGAGADAGVTAGAPLSLTSFSARSTATVIVEVLCVRPTGVKVRPGKVARKRVPSFCGLGQTLPHPAS
jgi:hypothetical protein